ncbi:MAG TPA: hypothetical protein PKZ83_09275 [bacterium]|nr:hypothetical protein [bacterium]
MREETVVFCRAAADIKQGLSIGVFSAYARVDLLCFGLIILEVIEDIVSLGRF